MWLPGSSSIILQRITKKSSVATPESTTNINQSQSCFSSKKVPEMASTKSIQKKTQVYGLGFTAVYPCLNPKTIHWTPAQPDLVGGFNPSEKYWSVVHTRRD